MLFSTFMFEMALLSLRASVNLNMGKIMYAHLIMNNVNRDNGKERGNSEATESAGQITGR